MDSAPYLVTLPLEILQLIIEHTHASGHWPLAQTCKHIYLNSQLILDRHRKAHQKFRITSDLNPLTVPNLLWSVFSHGVASIDAWHVREFEVWADRVNGQPWEIDADTGELQAAEGSDIVPWSFPDDDITYFCDKLLKVPSFFPEDDKSNYEQAREELQIGEDTLLKSLLLAHLPRIKVLRYARVGEAEHFSFKYLCGFILYSEAAGTLLPGFKSLEKVSIGINLDQDSAAVEPYKRSADELLALLCLPNLSEVYFAHLDGEFNLMEELAQLDPYGPQPPFEKISPIRTIILDKLENDLSEELIDFLARTPRGLQKLAIAQPNNERGLERSNLLAHQLSKYQQLSLQQLYIWSEDDTWTPALMSSMKPDQFIMFEDLRVVNICWEWIESSLDPTGAIQSRPELLERLFGLFQCSLPATIERVLFHGFPEEGGIFLTGEFGNSSLDYVDDAVEAMIKSRRYKNLKDVILGSFQKSLPFDPDTENGDLPFSKTIKAAEERGVSVYLNGSEVPAWFIAGDFFPQIPKRDCMVTGRPVAED